MLSRLALAAVLAAGSATAVTECGRPGQNCCWVYNDNEYEPSCEDNGVCRRGKCKVPKKPVSPVECPEVPETPEPSCGDNIVTPEAGEECEPKGVGSCGNDCKLVPPSCGDGIVQKDAGEECEPKGVGNCGDDCKLVPPSCGDGTVQTEHDEDCEPPSAGNCDADCKFVPPSCGDGTVQPENDEDCEPPSAGDCDANCKFAPPFCGDGIVQKDDGEECEPRNEGSCDDNCQFVPPPPGPPTTPPGPCARCKDDLKSKIAQVELTWDCDTDAPATLGKQKNLVSYANGVALFAGDDGKKLGGDLKLPGGEELHLSCSAPFGIGVRTHTGDKDEQTCGGPGCWKVTDTVSDGGNTFCDLCDGVPTTPGNPQQPSDTCARCKDDFKSKIAQVELTWTCAADPPATLGKQKNLVSYANGVALFVGDDGKKLGGDLKLPGGEELHLSCSAPFGIGIKTHTGDKDEQTCGGPGCWTVTGTKSDSNREFCNLCA